MEFSLFIKGIIIGFGMAVPIGPIGIMCIRKTLTEGRMHGIIIGLGAATADLLYSSMAAFGLTIISNVLVSEKFWFRLVGGLLLFFFGVKTFLARPSDPNITRLQSGILKSYFITLFLTLTNPLTIFGFFALFAAFGLDEGLSKFHASGLVIGVFSGSFLWFLSITTGSRFFRNKIELNGLKWVNRIAGVLIFISGIFAVISVI